MTSLSRDGKLASYAYDATFYDGKSLLDGLGRIFRDRKPASYRHDVVPEDEKLVSGNMTAVFDDEKSLLDAQGPIFDGKNPGNLVMSRFSVDEP